MLNRHNEPEITQLPLGRPSSHMGAHGLMCCMCMRCTLPVHALCAAYAVRCLCMHALPMHALHATSAC